MRGAKVKRGSLHRVLEKASWFGKGLEAHKKSRELKLSIHGTWLETLFAASMHMGKKLGKENLLVEKHQDRALSLAS
jgi:hypothetical protein